MEKGDFSNSNFKETQLSKARDAPRTHRLLRFFMLLQPYRPPRRHRLCLLFNFAGARLTITPFAASGAASPSPSHAKVCTPHTECAFSSPP